MSATNPVYQWLLADGTDIGCCTAAEFVYWQNEGVANIDDRLGAVISHEAASEDARRTTAWEQAA